jgi:type II secretory pathway component PulM
MGIATWLKQRRLERTHAKLKHLRAFQSKLRDRENDIVNQRKAGAPSTELEAKQRKLHEDREKLTREIKTLQAEEEKLKAELKTAA